jgi:hypothetical protein
MLELSVRALPDVRLGRTAVPSFSIHRTSESRVGYAASGGAVPDHYRCLHLPGQAIQESNAFRLRTNPLVIKSRNQEGNATTA